MGNECAVLYVKWISSPEGNEGKRPMTQPCLLVQPNRTVKGFLPHYY